MDGETLTYDEIIRRSEKDTNKKGFRTFIYFVIATLILFGLCYLISKNLYLSIGIAVTLLIVFTIIFLKSNLHDKYGLNHFIYKYKNEINEYNLVFDNYKKIYTNSHIIIVQNDGGLYTTVVELDNIKSIRIENNEYIRNDYSVFNIKLKDDKTEILFLPNKFKELLGYYLDENQL